jgi:manganese transport protein
MPLPPPTSFRERIRHLGPGLIITASIVGSGELIVVPKVGAAAGFALLWFLLLGCLVKVFVQIELARFAVCAERTTLAALDLLPGPRWRVSWVIWLWLLMYVGTLVQVGGIIGGLTNVCREIGVGGSETTWVVLITASCVLLLVSGRYRPVERWSAVMVAAFTLCTIFAVAALQWTPYALSGAEIASGLRFDLPASFTVAFAAFGVTGVGASELIFYPYWCLEKGYGRHIGPREESAPWLARARGWLRVMRLDAWMSLAIYAGATAAFYLLGAAVLHRRALNVTNVELVPTLAEMYRKSLGGWSMGIFLVGAFAVLYSTFFVATASNARLLVDLLGLTRLTRWRDAAARRRGVAAASVALPIFSAMVYALWPQPVTLVLAGAVAQGLMLPFLAFAALYLRRRPEVAGVGSGPIWSACLWVSALGIAAAGLYQVAQLW